MYKITLNLQVWESSYSTVEYQPIINGRLKWPQAVGNMVVNHWLTFYFHISVKCEMSGRSTDVRTESGK